MTVLDCRGMACPKPVVTCRDFVLSATEDEFQVVVDNEAAVQNVTSFLTGRGWGVESIAEEESTWRVSAARTSSPSADTESEACSCLPEYRVGKTLVFIPTPTMGRGDEDLGRRLMVNFLGTLPEMGEELWRIVLVNGGVKLAVGGPSVEKLLDLEKSGVTILVCGTCLEHYGLINQNRVGQTTNMLDIVTGLQLADKVIRL